MITVDKSIAGRWLVDADWKTVETSVVAYWMLRSMQCIQRYMVNRVICSQDHVFTMVTNRILPSEANRPAPTSVLSIRRIQIHSLISPNDKSIDEQDKVISENRRTNLPPEVHCKFTYCSMLLWVRTSEPKRPIKRTKWTFRRMTNLSTNLLQIDWTIREHAHRIFSHTMLNLWTSKSENSAAVCLDVTSGWVTSKMSSRI